MAVIANYIFPTANENKVKKQRDNWAYRIPTKETGAQILTQAPAGTSSMFYSLNERNDVVTAESSQDDLAKTSMLLIDN